MAVNRIPADITVSRAFVESVGARMALDDAYRGFGATDPGRQFHDAAKVELGRRLFYDADLSADGTMSCATCHEQKHAFADGNRIRRGAMSRGSPMLPGSRR
jgi:cytochrome c peroxidase